MSLVDDRLRVEAGSDPNARLTFADGATADGLGLSGAANAVVNVGRLLARRRPLRPGAGRPDPRRGRDGAGRSATCAAAAPTKTGLYALEDVDIFNLLCLPGHRATAALLAEAMAYCEERRAFLHRRPAGDDRHARGRDGSG